jgi:polyisoprenoid-binding protein YceI
VPRYRIVPERSRVWIDARSNVHPIHSSTDGLEGFVELELAAEGGVDLAMKPEAQLSVRVSRLSSGNRMEDREMQKRIDAQRYPTIEGVMDQMEPSGDDRSYRVSGDITFRGVARHFQDDMTVDSIDGQTIQLAGKSRFDIRDFGMAPPRVLMLRMEPEVDVRVEILAVTEDSRGAGA